MSITHYIALILAALVGSAALVLLSNAIIGSFVLLFWVIAILLEMVGKRVRSRG